MKKTVIYSLILVLCLFLGNFAFANPDRPRLSVRAFDNKTTNREVPAEAITDMMTTELFNAGLFSLVERERLSYVVDEIELGMMGLLDPSTAPEVGRVQGAQYAMTGAVTVYYYNTSGGVVFVPGIAGGGAASRTGYVTLDIRVIDTTTSAVVYAAAEQGSATRDAGGLVTRFGGFATATHGGILATATRDAVMKHVASMRGAFR